MNTDRKVVEINGEFSEADMQLITRFVPPLTMLRKVDLGSTNLNDDGLSRICSATSIECLLIGNTHVTRKGVRFVSQLDRLEEISLAEMQDFRGVFKSLAGCKNLRTISLKSCNIRNEDLAEAAFPGLRKLTLYNNPFDGANVAWVESFPDVEELSFERGQLTDDGIKGLAKLTHLRRLILSHTRVTDSGVAQLTGNEKIEALYLTRTQVSNASLPVFESMKNLKSLKLYATNVSSESIPSLKRLTNLKLLMVSKKNFSDEDLETLSRALPNCDVIAL